MAVDTPAKIVVLGAGPMGLEAALYARFLGYDVEIFEQGEIGANVRRWAHVCMFSPFHMNRSTLGLAAITAQDETYAPPADDELLTGEEWLERYLLPLSQTDLLADHIHEQTTIVSVGRPMLVKSDMPTDGSRADADFRVLVRDADGDERVVTSQIVIDTTGVFSSPNWLGDGGIPAIGEASLRSDIHYDLPAILTRDRERFAGRHTLLLGSGYSAATNAVSLGQLLEDDDRAKVTWVTRRPTTESGGPIRTISDDRLAERASLTSRANELAQQASDSFQSLAGTVVTRIERTDDKFQVTLSPTNNQDETTDDSDVPTTTIVVDEIIANVGYRPNVDLYRELQVHQCYATEGPMKLAASLLEEASADCLDQNSHGPDVLLNPEPDFYILGAKSYGRNSNFLFSIGLDQVRDLFSVIGDRADLDLYSGMKSLP